MPRGTILGKVFITTFTNEKELEIYWLNVLDQIRDPLQHEMVINFEEISDDTTHIHDKRNKKQI